MHHCRNLPGGRTNLRVHRSWLVPFLLLLVTLLGAEVFADEYAEIRPQLTLCFTCHGQNGASTQAKYPILAGQHLYYLYVQLKDFKSGFRASPIMGPLTQSLEKPQMMAMAKFFSEQQWPEISYKAALERVKKGQTATVAGQCVQCHLGGYEGNSRVPRLANQHPEYLTQTMLDFKHKVRNNSPAKGSLLESYSEDDVAAMAEYLADM